MINKRIFTLLALLLLCSCEERPGQVISNGPRYEVRTFRAGQGWAYAILINDKEYIRQLFIPAIPGRQQFASDALAKKTGLYVISKLKNNSSPSLSRAELMRLNIISKQQ